MKKFRAITSGVLSRAGEIATKPFHATYQLFEAFPPAFFLMAVPAGIIGANIATAPLRQAPLAVDAAPASDAAVSAKIMQEIEADIKTLQEGQRDFLVTPRSESERKALDQRLSTQFWRVQGRILMDERLSEKQAWQLMKTYESGPQRGWVLGDNRTPLKASTIAYRNECLIGEKNWLPQADSDGNFPSQKDTVVAFAGCVVDKKSDHERGMGDFMKVASNVAGVAVAGALLGGLTGAGASAHNNLRRRRQKRVNKN